ncbi:unnamed protein product [Dicrocoelium dendriticum]|nr:unnamed protein product [Dicrocoelium dendriticum]CAH8649140.1 unnamed protein product [Dicrocoelium dendriticum]
MSTTIQQFLTSCFWRLRDVVAPAHDMGLLNYLLEPVNSTDPEGLTFLKLSQYIENRTWVPLLEGMLLQSVQNLDVFRVITNNDLMAEQAIRRQPRQMMALLMICAIFILVTFMVSIGTIFTACCFWRDRLGCSECQRKTCPKPSTAKGMNEPACFMDSARAVLDNTSASFETSQLDAGANRSPSTTSSDFYVNVTAEYRNVTGHSDQTDVSTSGYELDPVRRHPSKDPILKDKHSNTSGPEKRDKILHYLYLSAQLLLTLLILGFLILQFYSMGSVFELSNPLRSDGPSLKTAVTNATNSIYLFLEQMIEQGENETDKLLANVKDLFLIEIGNAANRVIDALLESYKILPVFNVSDQLTPSINSVLNATREIRRTHAESLRILNQFRGQLDAYRSILVRSIENLCLQLSSTPYEASCVSELADARTLVFDFNPANVNADPSVGLQVLLETLNIDLTGALQALGRARQKVQETADMIVESMNKNFKIEELFKPLTTLWSEFNTSTARPIQNTVKRLQPQIYFYIDLMDYVISAGGYLTLVVHLVLLIAQLCYVGLILEDVRSHRLLAASGDLLVTGREHFRIGAIVGCISSAERSLDLAPLSSRPIELQFISMLLSVISLLCCFPALVCLALIPLLVLSNSEICRNLDYGIDLERTDKAIELFLRYEWPDIFNNKTLSPELLAMLKINPPPMLLTTVSIACNPNLQTTTSQGLLGKLGYSDILNFTTVLRGQQITKLLQDTETNLVKEITAIDFNALIPSNLENLRDMANQVTLSLDSINYESSYDELSKQFLPMPSLESYVTSLNTFVSSIPVSVESQSLNSVITLINDSVPEYNKAVDTARELAAQFKILIGNQMLNQLMDNLLDRVGDARKIVTNASLVIAPIRPIFRINAIILLDDVNDILKAQFQPFIETIVPCDNLFWVFEQFRSTVCSDQSFTNRLGANCILLSVCVFLVTLDLFFFTRLASLYTTIFETVGETRPSLQDCVGAAYLAWKHSKEVAQIS